MAPRGVSHRAHVTSKRCPRPPPRSTLRTPAQCVPDGREILGVSQKPRPIRKNRNLHSPPAPSEFNASPLQVLNLQLHTGMSTEYGVLLMQYGGTNVPRIGVRTSQEGRDFPPLRDPCTHSPQRSLSMHTHAQFDQSKTSSGSPS